LGTAAIASFSLKPIQTFADAIAVARELYLVWPNINPPEAIECFFAPDGNVTESIVCEMAAQPNFEWVPSSAPSLMAGTRLRQTIRAFTSSQMG
jgi:hypothetical protein